MNIGRVRVAAAKVLSKNLGFEVWPEDISITMGHNRSMDTYRWELFGYNNKVRIWAGCWERLTDFVKKARIKGCYIDDDRIIQIGKPQ